MVQFTDRHNRKMKILNLPYGNGTIKQKITIYDEDKELSFVIEDQFDIVFLSPESKKDILNLILDYERKLRERKLEFDKSIDKLVELKKVVGGE